MPAAQLPANERQRHAALIALDILDTPPARQFDAFPQMAANFLAAPISAISLVDTDRQWFKARIGLNESQTPRSISFCAHAILRPHEVLDVDDAAKDFRFADNPLVRGGMGVRAYAGAPIVVRGGHAIGALCVLDQKPRKFTADALGKLASLAEGVADAVEQHGTLQNLRQKQRETGLMQTMIASVFQKVDAPVLIVRSSGAILLGNAAYQALAGYAADELPLLTMEQLLAPDDRAAVAAAHAQFAARGEPYKIDGAIMHKDGSRIPVHVTSASVQRSGAPLFSVVTLRPLDTSTSDRAPPEPMSVTGCIQFFGLEPVKAAYGPRWPEVRNGLLLAAENILKRRLREEDVYSRTDDDGFSVWFKEGSEEENAVRMARMRREIQVMLLGELGEDTNCSVGTYTQIEQIADRTTTPAEIMMGLTERLASRRREAEDQARTLIDQVIRDQPSELTPICNHAGAINASFADLPRPLRARFVGALSLVCGPSADIDCESLRLGLAVQAVLDDVAKGRDGTKFIAISAAVFASRRGRENFMNQWRTLPASVCARLFVLLSDVSQASQARLTETAMMLQPSKGLGLILDKIEPPPCNPQSRVFSMIALSSESAGTLPDAKLRAFVQKLHQAKMRVLVRLNEGELPRRWLGLGADLTTYA